MQTASRLRRGPGPAEPNRDHNLFHTELVNLVDQRHGLLLVHRLRHANGFGSVFHEIYGSPVQTEVLTSFYKHPVEITADSLLKGLLTTADKGRQSLNGAVHRTTGSWHC